MRRAHTLRRLFLLSLPPFFSSWHKFKCWFFDPLDHFQNILFVATLNLGCWLLFLTSVCRWIPWWFCIMQPPWYYGPASIYNPVKSSGLVASIRTCLAADDGFISCAPPLLLVAIFLIYHAEVIFMCISFSFLRVESLIFVSVHRRKSLPSWPICAFPFSWSFIWLGDVASEISVKTNLEEWVYTSSLSLLFFY